MEPIPNDLKGCVSAVIFSFCKFEPVYCFAFFFHIAPATYKMKVYNDSKESTLLKYYQKLSIEKGLFSVVGAPPGFSANVCIYPTVVPFETCARTWNEQQSA